MESFEFISNYEKYVGEIGSVINSDLMQIHDKMAATDPHDLIIPDTWFPSETAARGYVWSLFLKAIKEQSQSNTKQSD